MPVDLLLLLLLLPPLGLARAQNLPRRLHGGGSNEAASAVLGQILGCVCVLACETISQKTQKTTRGFESHNPRETTERHIQSRDARNTRLLLEMRSPCISENASPEATSGIPSQ